MKKSAVPPSRVTRISPRSPTGDESGSISQEPNAPPSFQTGEDTLRYQREFVFLGEPGMPGTAQSPKEAGDHYIGGLNLMQMAESEGRQHPELAQTHLQGALVAFEKAWPSHRHSPEEASLYHNVGYAYLRLAVLEVLPAKTREYLLKSISALTQAQMILQAKNLLETSPKEASLWPEETKGSELVRSKSIITRGGIRYYPLSLAATVTQASESALRKWLENRIKFAGRAIKPHVSLTGDLYVSEESVERISNRFVRWPSNRPALSVTLGETDDQSGYLGLIDVSKLLHIGHHTIWLWVTQNKAPLDKPLDVVKCTVSDYFYIRERDVAALKASIPPSGLRRGRRPQKTTDPKRLEVY